MNAFPKADLSLSVVWVDVLIADGYPGARRSSQLFDDPRVAQFHDRDRRVARLFAPFIGMPAMKDLADLRQMSIPDFEDIYKHDFVHGNPAAFDSVFFFTEDASWEESVPKPLDWVTQLDPSMFEGVDPDHFRYGEALGQQMNEIAGKMLRTSSKVAPR